MEAFLAGMATSFSPYILSLVVAGTFLGIIVGALPGISGSTTTLKMPPMALATADMPRARPASPRRASG